MMRQNGNPPDVPSAPPDPTDFTFEQRVDLLCESTGNAIILMGRKKQLLSKLRNVKQNIVEYAEELDNKAGN